MKARMQCPANPHLTHFHMTCTQTKQAGSDPLRDVRRHAEDGPTHQKVKHYVVNGFSAHHSQLLEECRTYWINQEHCTVEDDLVIYGCCLLILAEMRRGATGHT